MTRVIYMGTPDFAVGPLKALAEDSSYEVVLTVTRPDAPVGRKQILTPSPVKETAMEYGISVFQPVNFKTGENIEYLRRFGADVMVVAAYGNILPEAVLDMVPFGCINIHASLLPKYRGAAPIQWAIINGEEKTGVTIMKMDKGVDTGDIISQREYVIRPDETGASLFDRLSVTGTELLMDTLPDIVSGKAGFIKQDETLASKVGMIKKSDALLDFSMTASELERRVRGFYGWPVAYTYLRGKSVKLHEAKVSESDFSGESGKVFISDGRVFVCCGKGSLEILRLQPEGKKPLSASDCLNGRVIKEGDRFDSRIA